MKQKSFFKFLLTIWVSSTLLTSCMTDVDLSKVDPEIQIDESLVLPIGESSVTVEELVDKLGSTNDFDVEGTEVYFYRHDSAEFKFREIDLLEHAQTLTKDLLPSPIYSMDVNPYTPIPEATLFDTLKLGINSIPNVERIDSAHIESAELGIQISVSNDLATINPSELQFKLEFPDGRIKMLNGTSSTISFNPSAFDNPTNKLITNFMMYTTDLVSGVPIKIIINARAGAQTLHLSPSTKITCKIVLNKMSFKVAYGKFEPSTKAIQTIERNIDLNTNLPIGDIKFANPKSIVTAISNIGSYLSFQLNYIKAFVVGGDPAQDKYANFAGSRSLTQVFGKKPSTPGKTVEIQLDTLDNVNGHTDQLFDDLIRPNKLIYEFTVKTVNNVDQSVDFITPDATIKVKIESRIPFYLKKGSNFVYTDSIQKVGESFQSVLGNNVVDEAILVLNVTNGFPLKATIELVDLVDSLGTPILQDNFEKKYIIQSPIVDAISGKATVVTTQTPSIQIKMSKSQIEEMKRIKNLKFKVTFEGQDSEKAIHFTKDDKFKIKLGVYVKGTVITSFGASTK